MIRPAIIDFSQVEEALRLSSREREVLTARERTKNSAHLIKYIAGGTALVIVSIGVAFWLGTQWSRPPSTSSRPHNLSGVWETSTASSANTSVPENKVMTNVTLFRTIQRADLGIANPYLISITAGHRYPSSNADTWEQAWCYAEFQKNGLRYQVDLENRIGSAVLPRLVSKNERQELGLSDGDESYMRARCPWK